MSEDMPEKIWAIKTDLNNKIWDDREDVTGFPCKTLINESSGTQYRLKSTVDAEREADSKTIRSLEGDLEMSNESIRLSREHLKKVGIHAAFFDDCVALSAKKILEQQKTIRELAAALDQVLDDLSSGTMVFPGHGVCEQAWNEAMEALSDNAPRIAESQEDKG